MRALRERKNYKMFLQLLDGAGEQLEQLDIVIAVPKPVQADT